VKRTASVVIAFSAALLFIGCARDGGRSRTPALVLWETMSPDQRARLERNLEAFRTSHPGLDVRHRPVAGDSLAAALRAAAASGAAPHLIFASAEQIAALARSGLVRPLETTLPPGFFNRFVPAALDTLDGHLYEAPDQIGDQLMLCFNRRLLPIAPETGRQFLDAARRLTQIGPDPRAARYGFAMDTSQPDRLVALLGGYGGWVVDERGHATLETAAMVRALTFVRDLETRDKVMPPEREMPDVEALFREGRAAMIVDRPESWPEYREAGIDLGVAPIFRLPAGEWARPMTTTRGYAMSADVTPEALPLVIELLAFLTSPEAQLRSASELGILPSHKNAYADSALLADPIVQASQRAVELGRPMPLEPDFRILMEILRPAMRDVANGLKTPREAAHEMQSAADQRMAATP